MTGQRNESWELREFTLVLMQCFCDACMRANGGREEVTSQQTAKDKIQSCGTGYQITFDK